MTEPPLTLLPAGEQAAFNDALAGPEGEMTVSCPECGEQFTGGASGRTSAKWKLGTHRYNRHGVRGSSERRKPKASRGVTSVNVPGADDNRPGLAAVADIRSAARGGRASGAPTEADLSAGLGRALQLATVAGASFVVETDSSIPEGEYGNQIREQLVDYLSLDEGGARAAMSPVGRLLAPTKFNKNHGRKIIDNADVVGSISDVALLFMHWRTALRARSVPGGLMALATGAPAPIAAPQFIAAAMPSPYDTPPPLPDPVDTATPPMTTGQVLSAEDIAAMHAQRNGGN